MDVSPLLVCKNLFNEGRSLFSLSLQSQSKGAGRKGRAGGQGGPRGTLSCLGAWKGWQVRG